MQKIPLEEEVGQIEEEARMLIPGIQALFGFQLVAGFDRNFTELLAHWLQDVHLAALMLTTLSVMLVMAPAAYHRQAEPGSVSHTFVRLASRLITLAMIPLMLAISLDVFVIGWLITRSYPWAGAISLFALCGFVSLWFVYPQIWARKRQREEPEVEKAA